jgi:hypothetical protein
MDQEFSPAGGSKGVQWSSSLDVKLRQFSPQDAVSTPSQVAGCAVPQHSSDWLGDLRSQRRQQQQQQLQPQQSKRRRSVTWNSSLCEFNDNQPPSPHVQRTARDQPTILSSKRLQRKQALKNAKRKKIPARSGAGGGQRNEPSGFGDNTVANLNETPAQKRFRRTAAPEMVRKNKGSAD